MEVNFCRRCGTHAQHISDNHYTCEQKHALFADASPGAGVLLVNDKNEVLLGTRSIEPGKGKLTYPGGFSAGDETLEQTAIRELKEETGVTPEHFASPLSYVGSSIIDYTYDGETRKVLGVGFWARIADLSVIKAGDDMQDVAFYALDDFDYTLLAFDQERPVLEALAVILKTA